MAWQEIDVSTLTTDADGVICAPDGRPVVLVLEERWDEVADAAKAVIGQLDYLQGLWGAEGVTHGLAERLRKAVEAMESD